MLLVYWMMLTILSADPLIQQRCLAKRLDLELIISAGKKQEDYFSFVESSQVHFNFMTLVS